MYGDNSKKNKLLQNFKQTCIKCTLPKNMIDYLITRIDVMEQPLKDITFHNGSWAYGISLLSSMQVCAVIFRIIVKAHALRT